MRVQVGRPVGGQFSKGADKISVGAQGSDKLVDLQRRDCDPQEDLVNQLAGTYASDEGKLFHTYPHDQAALASAPGGPRGSDRFSRGNHLRRHRLLRLLLLQARHLRLPLQLEAL